MSEPYFQGAARYWNGTVYDDIGRITAMESASGDDFLREYGSAAAQCGVSGAHAVRTNNAEGQARFELRDSPRCSARSGS